MGEIQQNVLEICVILVGTSMAWLKDHKFWFVGGYVLILGTAAFVLADSAYGRKAFQIYRQPDRLIRLILIPYAGGVS